MSKNKRSANRKKLFLRIFCGVLAAMLALGGLASFAYLFIDHVHAADYPEELRVHIGLKYGSSMAETYTATSASGFSVVNQNVSDRTMPYEEMFQTSLTKVIIAAAKNLVKTGSTYYGTSSTSADIGGYSLQSNRQFSTYSAAEKYIKDKYASKLSGYNIYVAYEGSTSRFRIRIGDYTSSDAAQSASETVRSKIGDAVSIIEPGTSVYLIDPGTGKIIFAYGDHSSACLGLRPLSETNTISTVNTWYDGTLVYKCATHNGAIKLRLTNVMDLEPYVERVIVSEIYASWPLETQKAFAVAVRTYTLANLNKHSRYGFDLCASTDCQAYDATSLYDRSHRAAMETAGQVLAYEGRVASIYYSSSTGGITVSAEEAFGPSAAKPYLVAVETPWEKYTIHSGGFWRLEATPEQLATALRSRGYTKIKDAVEEIRILQFAENSTYVYKLEVTDIHGNTVVIERCENVRLAFRDLDTYPKSANFVVGRGSVLYTTNVDDSVVENPEAGLDAEPKFSVKTAWGTLLARFVKGLNVISGQGYVTLPDRAASVITAHNVAKYTGNVPESDTDYEIYYASDENNFVFVGKGWGHGVGMSQWGLKDMGDLSYTYEQMLAAYYPTVDVKHFRDLN